MANGALVKTTAHALDRYRERIGPLPDDPHEARCFVRKQVESGEPPPPGILRKCHVPRRHTPDNFFVYHAPTRALFVVKELPDRFLIVTVLRPKTKQPLSPRAARAAEQKRAERAYRVKGYEFEYRRH